MSIFFYSACVSDQQSAVGGGDYSKLFSGLVVLDAFCNTKKKYNFQNFQNLFLTPPTRGLKFSKNPL